jgi:hypothetical protein
MAMRWEWETGGNVSTSTDEWLLAGADRGTCVRVVLRVLREDVECGWYGDILTVCTCKRCVCVLTL